MNTEIVYSSLKSTPVRILPPHNPHLYPKAVIGHEMGRLHLHDEVEFLEATIGSVGVRAAGRETILSVGESVLIKSRVPHQTFYVCDYSSHMGIQFQPDLFNESQSPSHGKYLSRFINSGDMTVFRLSDPATQELHNYMSTIIDEYNKKQPSYELYIKANIQLMLACFYRHGVLNNADTFFDSREIRKILPLLKYIDENYNETITLEQAGKILNLNCDYFCRLFKKATNTTFTDYLNFVRVCHTETPLTFSDKSIAEISLDAGFASVSYFNRVFKKYKLISPSEYRRSKYRNL